MKTRGKKPTPRSVRKSTPSRRRTARPVKAAVIRQIGDQWAQNFNARDLDKVVTTYAADAVYLPPHHEAVHGRDSIREYLRTPLAHGVSELSFDVSYIKQSGNIAWDVGTYRMRVPQSDGTTREDRGKYLTVWKRTGTKWWITADAWSSDLPPSH
jgi:uncharacterized protein (TIGR02246 family)